jgi:hypothetical protein
MRLLFPSLPLLALSISGVASSSHEKRKLFIDRIVGYMPTSDVTDHLMIDLDQYNIEEQLMQRKIRVAKLVYEQGGHSHSYAVLNMSTPAGSFAFEGGSSVWAPNEYGMEIKGTLMNDIVWDDQVNATQLISVLYDQDQDYDHCQVGALYLSSEASLRNCTYRN